MHEPMSQDSLFFLGVEAGLASLSGLHKSQGILDHGRWIPGREILDFQLQSILIIWRFCICKFAYLLQFLCNPQINTCSTFAVICKHAQSDKNVNSPTYVPLAGVEQYNAVPSCFSSHPVNKCPFAVLCLRPHFSHFCTFVVGDFTV